MVQVNHVHNEPVHEPTEPIAVQLEDLVRQGSIRAIAQLLSTLLSPHRIEVLAYRQERELALFFVKHSMVKRPSLAHTPPRQALVVAKVADCLLLLAPKDIDVVTLFGVAPSADISRLREVDDTPTGEILAQLPIAWLDWLELPESPRSVSGLAQPDLRVTSLWRLRGVRNQGLVSGLRRSLLFLPLFVEGAVEGADEDRTEDQDRDTDTVHLARSSGWGMATVLGVVGVTISLVLDLGLGVLVQMAAVNPEQMANSSGGSEALSSKDSARTGTRESTLDLGPTYPSFNLELLDQKLALYRQYVLDNGPPDVLIIGSSRAFRGVDPTTLQTALMADGRPPIKVFNFGINGATAQVVDLIVRQLLPGDRLPKVVVWADGVRAFNSGRPDTTYDTLAASPAYQHLEAGTLPPLLSPALSPTLSPTQPSGLPVTKPRSWYERLEVTDRALSTGLAQVSTVADQGDRLKVIAQETLVTLLPESFFGNPCDVNSPDPSTALACEIPIEANGFLPMPVEFNPKTYFEHFQYVSGEYDGDYDSFQLQGPQDKALKQLLAYTRKHGVPVVFVNLPLTATYLDPIRQGFETQFRTYMKTHAHQEGLIFRDFSQLWPRQHQFFSDPSHLNMHGAQAVSRQLAQDDAILLLELSETLPGERVQPESPESAVPET